MGCLYKRKQKLKDGTYRELPTWWLKYYQSGRAIRESAETTKETVARRMLRARATSSTAFRSRRRWAG